MSTDCSSTGRSSTGRRSTRWSIWRITAALYPLGAGAAAVNLFFASLITSWWGWPVLTPWTAIAGGAVLGLPATYYFARHIRNLMDVADKSEPH